MLARHLHGRIAAMLLGTVSLACIASDFESTLREADLVRSSQPAHFIGLLDDLEGRRQEADEGQRQRLLYLDAYRKIVYDNKVQAGIAQAESIFKDAKDPDLKFRAGSLAANSLAINRNFTEALRYLNQTLPVRGKVRDKDIRDDGVNTAATLYNQLGQYELGLSYAMETLSGDPNPRARCNARFLRVEAQFHLDLLARDDTSIAPVIAECAALGENFAANFSRLVLARQLARHGRRDEASKLLAENLSEVDQLGYARLIAEYRAMLADFSLRRGDDEAARRNAQAVVALAAQVSSSRPLAVAYRTLFEIAQHGGDTRAALTFYQRYAEADKAWLNEVKVREMAYLLVQQEATRQAQQIELLNKRNEVLQLHQGISEQKAQAQRLLILLLVVLVGSVSYWAFKTKRLQMSLRRMAETDALTGICNRHHFNQQSGQTLVQAARAGEDVALVMFDLDHFKSINDRFGHDTGDWVLKTVSGHCRTFCRRVDHLGRIGGEEFAILLSGCDLRGAKRVAEDCRVRIASIETQPSGHRFLITASFGVTASSLSGYDLAKLLSHADKALYRSKREGRNRVSTFDGDMQPWTQLQAVADDGSPAAGMPTAHGEASDRPFRGLMS
jgi:diguanylate cyclase (GGDEF)-like protein